MTLTRAVLVAGVCVCKAPPHPRKWVQKEMGGEIDSAQRKQYHQLGGLLEISHSCEAGSPRSGVDRLGSWCSHSSWLIVGCLLPVARMARQISGVVFASPTIKPHPHDRL